MADYRTNDRAGYFDSVSPKSDRRWVETVPEDKSLVGKLPWIKYQWVETQALDSPTLAWS